MWGSDHRPLMIGFVLEQRELKRGRFYLDNRLFHRQGFEDVVVQSWGDTGDPASIMDRNSQVRRGISKWKKTSDLNSHERILRLKAALEKEISKLYPIRAVLKRIKKQLAEAYKDEERYWRQKCKEEWLREGDRNTKYFHNVVKGKKVQNRLLMLYDHLGNEHFSEGSKGEIATEYFRELFLSSNPYELESLFDGFQGRVSDEMNANLIAPVTEDEIKKAALSVNGGSAPGEDGLTGTFYHKYWHIVGPAVTREVQSFFDTAVLPEGWNHTQLSLIPKVLHADKMQDLRPISLCFVQYKIISKILCNRLKVILPVLVSETQGAFVADRLISDNIIIAHEMVHALRTKESVSRDFMAIKTDMSKAYDRVEWCFLETLLERMGFAREWVRWIMSCVSTVSYSVLLNGASHGFIKPERGLRQGDPLSPFLFILCAEALVNGLNASADAGKLHGIKLGASGPAVHHLLFADDSLLMCKANALEAAEIMRCLQRYGDASGQMINPLKSSVIFGSKVPLDVRIEVQGILHIDKEGGEGTYLGLPECFSGSKRQLLSFIRSKLHGRLNGWFAKALSHGGKEILLKSVCLSLPIYVMSCFRLPKGTCACLVSAMTEFWWISGSNRRKIAWVSWQKLCKSKKEGGMGFKDLEMFNQALLGKHASRIWTNPDSLVARVLKHR